MRHHERECEREHGCEQPVREAPEGLSLRAQLLREYLGDEHPDDRTLPECVRDDEEEDARRRIENSKDQQELQYAEMKLQRALNRLRVSSMKD